MNTVKENMVLKSTVYVQLKALLPLLLVIHSPTLFALVVVNLQTGYQEIERLSVHDIQCWFFE